MTLQPKQLSNNALHVTGHFFNLQNMITRTIVVRQIHTACVKGLL